MRATSKHWRLLLVAVATFATLGEAVPPTTSPEFVPTLLNLHSTDEDSVLSAECTGNAPFREIDCRFEQMTLRLPSPETEAASKEEEKLVNEMRAELAQGTTKLRKTCHDLELKAKRRSRCSEDPPRSN